MTKPIKRPYETRYWLDRREKTPIVRGFPKAEAGSIDGAAKAAMKGLVAKVQCIDRHNDQVLWTVIRGDKVPGRNLYNVKAVRGDVPKDKG